MIPPPPAIRAGAGLNNESYDLYQAYLYRQREDRFQAG